jgi:hypothetical protein
MIQCNLRTCTTFDKLIVQMDSIRLMNIKQEPLNASQDPEVINFRPLDQACLACFWLFGASEEKGDAVQLGL